MCLKSIDTPPRTVDRRHWIEAEDNNPKPIPPCHFFFNSLSVSLSALSLSSPSLCSREKYMCLAGVGLSYTQEHARETILTQLLYLHALFNQDGTSHCDQITF